MLYWAFVTFMDKASARRAVSVSVWVSTLIGFYAILEHFGIDADLWVQDVQNRVFSTLGQPNWLAAYLTVLILPAQVPLIEKPRWYKYLPPVILITALLFTKSRSGLLAFGLSSAVFWGYLLLRQRSKALKPFIITAVLTLTLTLTFSNPVRDLFTSPPPVTPGKVAGPALEVGGTESGIIRKIVWTGAVRSWLSSPKNILIGTGPETFTMAYYRHRPVEHNFTSEWQLLYNKAHNEFLNFLTTTGVLGTAAYLLLLFSMFRQLLSQITKPQTPAKNKVPDSRLLLLALFTGWLTLPVTNFFGFSVVAVQLLLFLLPAMSLALNETKPADFPSARLTSVRIILILTTVSAGGFLLLGLFRYWLADVKYASGQNQVTAFTLTQNSLYLLKAYDEFALAYDLNSADPPIISEFSQASAYISVLAAESGDATAAAQLADNALILGAAAISASPGHPNYYKSLAKTAWLLSTAGNNHAALAVSALETAADLSPTDPQIPHTLGVILAGSDPEAAGVYFHRALELKPDYAQAKDQLEKLASASAQPVD